MRSSFSAWEAPYGTPLAAIWRGLPGRVRGIFKGFATHFLSFIHAATSADRFYIRLPGGGCLEGSEPLTQRGGGRGKEHRRSVGATQKVQSIRGDSHCEWGTVCVGYLIAESAMQIETRGRGSRGSGSSSEGKGIFHLK